MSDEQEQAPDDLDAVVKVLLDITLTELKKAKKTNPNLKSFKVPKTFSKQAPSVLLDALRRKRKLPGFKLIRTAKPPTDIMIRIRKKLRRALNSEFFKYRKALKAPQRALVMGVRAASKKAYKY
jgi:hypothetical protein